MLWAAACMYFFGFLHCGEVVIPSDSTFNAEAHLAHGDVRVNDVASPQFLEVHLKASKIDPFQLGVSVYLGQTNKSLCLVAGILDYMVVRVQRQVPSSGLRMAKD